MKVELTEDEISIITMYVDWALTAAGDEYEPSEKEIELLKKLGLVQELLT